MADVHFKWLVNQPPRNITAPPPRNKGLMAGPKIKGNQRLISHDHKACYFWWVWLTGHFFGEITYQGIELYSRYYQWAKRNIPGTNSCYTPSKTDMIIGKTTINENVSLLLLIKHGDFPACHVDFQGWN